MTQRVPLPAGPRGSGMASSWSQHGQAEESLKEALGWVLWEAHRPPGPHASPSGSEPDLITAHAGHSVDVAQHGETDEACGSEMRGAL